MSEISAGINDKAVPWGGAQQKYAEPRKQHNKKVVFMLDGKRNDVIFGDFS